MSCLKKFKYYNEEYQKRITPNMKISELKNWLVKNKGINESCTFIINGEELGDEDCTFDDILEGNFDLIKETKIIIRDFELEKKKKEEEEKKRKEAEKLLEERKELEIKEKNFQRDLIGTYSVKTTKENMSIQKYPDNPFNSNEEQICKTIMVIGQTGAGKTTLLNSIINYILHIKLSEKRRFMIIQEYNTSQVQSVTSFTSIHYIKSHNNYPYIKIIDTPGLGDTKGINKDLEITAQLTKLLYEEIEQLDAICFVIKSSDVRLTSVQKYIFNSIIDLFDKDMSNKFIIMLTFSDPNKPEILKALEEKDSGFENIIPYLEKPYYLKFNCSSIFNDKIEDPMVKVYWEMCMKSMSEFISKLSNLKPQSLKKTRLLLKYRQRRDILIESCIYFQTIIEDLNTKKGEIEKNIENTKKTIELTKNFNTEDKYTVITKVDLPVGISTCTCNICKITCHENCKYPDDSKKRNCEIYDNDGNCTICPKKCPWNQHYNPIGFKLVPKKVSEISNNEDLEKLYKESISKEQKLNEELKKINNEISQYKDKIQRFETQISIVNEMINSHRINPKTNKCFLEYIEERIKQTEENKNADWGINQKKLVMCKNHYELIYKIENNQNFKKSSFDIENFIHVPFVEEQEKKTQTFLFFGDNQIEKNQMIILFIEKFIDLSEEEKIYKFPNNEDQINIYYIRAYKPLSYVKIIDCPVFKGKRNDVNLMEKLLQKLKETNSNIDNIFLLFKEESDLEEHFNLYVNYFAIISKEFQKRFYIIFYDRDTISDGDFNFLSLEDNNIFNIFLQNQINFQSKLMFQNIKGFYQKKNYSYLLQKIKEITEGKNSIDSTKFINLLNFHIILRKSLFSQKALNSFKNLKTVIQNIIKDNTDNNKKILDDLINKLEIIVFEKILDLLQNIKKESLFEMLFELPMFLNILNNIEINTNDSNSEENIQYLKLMKFILNKVKNNSFSNKNLSNQLVELFQKYILN